MTKGAGVRFLIYFVLALGWIWLYVRHPELSSNAPFVYQEF